MKPYLMRIYYVRVLDSVDTFSSKSICSTSKSPRKVIQSSFLCHLLFTSYKNSLQNNKNISLVEVNQALYAWSFRQGINDSPSELNL